MIAGIQHVRWPGFPATLMWLIESTIKKVSYQIFRGPVTTENTENSHLGVLKFLVKTCLFLLENSGTSESQTEYVAGLKTSVDDLSIMVNNLLNFSVLVSEKITLKTEELQIVDFLKSIKRIVNLKGDKSNQTIEFELDENLPEKIISDQKKLTQLFYNIIDFSSNRAGSTGNIHVSVTQKDVSDT